MSILKSLAWYLLMVNACLSFPLLLSVHAIPRLGSSLNTPSLSPRHFQFLFFTRVSLRVCFLLSDSYYCPRVPRALLRSQEIVFLWFSPKAEECRKEALLVPALPGSALVHTLSSPEQPSYGAVQEETSKRLTAVQ